MQNYEYYYDINKAAEGLARQLLNMMYGLELVDLNTVKANYPGLDLGDSGKSKIGFQITSRTDSKKIIENLESIVSESQDKIFTGGIRFLILDLDKRITFRTNAKKKPGEVLSTFDVDKDIIYPEKIIRDINDIYEQSGDLLKFNRIKALLEKLLIPLFSGSTVAVPPEKVEKMQNDITRLLKYIENKGSDEIKFDNTFFQGDLSVPLIKPASKRAAVVSSIVEILKNNDAIWLQSPPASGKTSVACLICDSIKPSYWLECRDVSANQLVGHLISLFCGFFKIKPGETVGETFQLIGDQIASKSLFVFNDIPDLIINPLVQQHFLQMIKVLVDKESKILVTTNHNIPQVIFNNFGIEAEFFILTAFNDEDTEELLESVEAPSSNRKELAKLIRNVTDGHPLLIQAAGKFLLKNGWNINDQVLTDIFTGKYGEVIDREIYLRVISHTSDEDSRELLYRLQCTIGDFSIESIHEVAAIAPTIDQVGEKIAVLTNTWLQKTKNGSYQLSPLIKRLTSNLSAGIKKSVNHTLAKQILRRESISQFDSLKAFQYYSLAGELDNAAIVLFKSLSAFIDRPELFYESGYQFYWYNCSIPEGVTPLFRVYIRFMQILIADKYRKDTSFLRTDIDQIRKKEDVGPMGRFMVECILMQHEMTNNPLSAMRHLQAMLSSRADLSQSLPISSEIYGDNEWVNVVWLAFMQLNSDKDYKLWFEIYSTLSLSDIVNDPNVNVPYILAGQSIYRNVVQGNEKEPIKIEQLLLFIIQASIRSNVLLISAYAIRSLIRMKFDNESSSKLIEEYMDKYKLVWEANPIFKFLVFAEIGSRYFYANNYYEAGRYLKEIENVDIPDDYTERLDYYLVAFQVAYKSSPELSRQLLFHALELVKGDLYLIIDKVALYGEAAIALIEMGDIVGAAHHYATGYNLLLDNFDGTEGMQAQVIRYGNAVKYLSELIHTGIAQSFGEDKNVIPEPGYFFRTNEELLKNGFYFEERKFMVASILQDCFESLGNVEEASRFAYKSIELSQDLPNAQYVPILQSNVHYLIRDKKYLAAYNLMEYVESYYRRLRAENVDISPEKRELQERIKDIRDNDLGLYYVS